MMTKGGVKSIFLIVLMSVFIQIRVFPKGDLSFIDDSIKAITTRIGNVSIKGDTIDIIKYSGKRPDLKGTYDFRAHIQRAMDERYY